MKGFEFLGFVHYWARSKRGACVVMRKTATGRLGRAVKLIYDWCRRNCHQPLGWQHQHLVRKLRGHDNYRGITANCSSLHRFRYEVWRVWMKWLGHRSNARMSWERFERVLRRYPLPLPVLRHWVWASAANP